MDYIRLEDVYKDSGVPEYNFVESEEYFKTKIALRTEGRGVIIEGPSGIGKTSCVMKILEELDIKPTILSALKKDDIDLIKLLLAGPRGMGMVIIDDFHRLNEDTKSSLTDLLKIGADESRMDFKLVLIGINQAGDTLVKLSPEINNRIETIRFENNPADKIHELITKGEHVLNIYIQDKERIIEKACGSFHIAQMLCKEMCIINRIDQTQDVEKELITPCEQVINSQMHSLKRSFGDAVKTFVRGNKMRKAGNHPYLKLLQALSKEANGVISMTDLCNQQPYLRASITQITTKNYLATLIQRNPSLQKSFFYDVVSNTLTIEDPKLLFYLKNLDWVQLSVECGFTTEDSVGYSCALSFAGAERKYAEAIARGLEDREVTCFYDFDHQADILAQDVEAYLAPIYSSDARYVIVLLSETYPKKYWTTFESKQFKDRFGENAVIPICFDGYAPDQQSQYFGKGRIEISTTNDFDSEIARVVDILFEKIDR